MPIGKAMIGKASAKFVLTPKRLMNDCRLSNEKLKYLKNPSVRKLKKMAK
jgi:hypothetical protein